MLKLPRRVPFGPINNIQQTFEHPQVRVALNAARGSKADEHATAIRLSRGRLRWKWRQVVRSGHWSMLADAGALAVQHPRSGKIKLVAPAVTYDGQKMAVRRAPPWLSEHTTEVSKCVRRERNSGLNVLAGAGGARLHRKRDSRPAGEINYLIFSQIRMTSELPNKGHRHESGIVTDRKCKQGNGPF